MSAKKKMPTANGVTPQKTEKPTLKAGEVFAAVCKKCDFLKLRKKFGDARGWQRDHGKANPTHKVAIEARKPEAKEKPKAKAPAVKAPNEKELTQ